MMYKRTKCAQRECILGSIGELHTRSARLLWTHDDEHGNKPAPFTHFTLTYDQTSYRAGVCMEMESMLVDTHISRSLARIH